MSTLMSGYIDRSGRFAIGPTLRTAEPFCDGLARIKKYGEVAFGYIDRAGAWVVPPEVACYGEWTERTAIYNVGGRWEDGDLVGGTWGILGDGRVLVAPRFAELRDCAGGLLAYREGDLWGFVDRNGKVVIGAQFEDVGYFSKDGLAMAQQGGKQGVIDKNGAWRVQPSVLQIVAPSDGFGLIQTQAGWHLLDHGLRAISEPYEDLKFWRAGMTPALRDELWTVLGADGKPITEEWFGEVRDYTDGLAVVTRDDETFVLAASGKLHGPFDNAILCDGGLARVVVADRGVGLIDAEGRMVVDPIFDSLRGFYDGLAPARRDGKWTLIDRAGREAYPPRWDDIGTPAEGMVPVRVGWRWGVADLRGELVVQPAFDTIAPFASGLAAARAVTWPAIEPPPAAWHCVPTEGLTHAGFASADAGDELRVHLCLSENVTDDRSIQMQQIVANWTELLRGFTGGADPLARPAWYSDYAISVRIANLPFPAQALWLLTQEIAAIGMPIKDVFFGRFRKTDDFALQFVNPYKATPHPYDPQGPSMFADFEEYARACFDPQAVPPASESLPQLLAGRWNGRAERMSFDERLFTLWHPEVRICYGATQDEVIDRDARSEQVGEAIREALATRFDRRRIWFFPPNRDPGPPAPMNRDEDVGVEPIVLALDGKPRRGYWFALPCRPLIQDVGPDEYRYREPELMEALAQVIRALGLAPVIMWQRFGDPQPGMTYPGWAHPMDPTFYEINLWER